MVDSLSEKVGFGEQFTDAEATSLSGIAESEADSFLNAVCPERTSAPSCTPSVLAGALTDQIEC